MGAPHGPLDSEAATDTAEQKCFPSEVFVHQADILNQSKHVGCWEECTQVAVGVLVAANAYLANI